VKIVGLFSESQHYTV